jgi:predicted PurR-regulated permease PerM
MSAAKERVERGPVLRFVVGAAAVVVVFAGLKAAATVLLPIMFAVFLTIAVLPGLRWLCDHGVPRPMAIALVVSVLGAILFAITGFFAEAVRTFSEGVSRYEVAFDQVVTDLMAWTQMFGLHFGGVADLLTPADVMDLVGGTLTTIIGVLGRVILVMILVTFMLIEASEIEKKLAVAFGPDGWLTGPHTRTAERIQRYLLLKFALALVTGLLDGLACWALGVDFYVMWGLLAFVLDFIPSIGSILSAVPPALVAIAQYGWGTGVAVVFAFFLINILIGNALEPRLMGYELELSPLVVVVSLILWGFIWGPVGMLMCVPMTVVAKLLFEATPETRWVAVFLGPPSEARKRVTTIPPQERTKP